MKVLVLGAEGMLGHKMYQILVSRFPDTACTVLRAIEDPLLKNIPLFQEGDVIDRLNALDFEMLAAVLRKRRPEYLVNCIGIIKQRSEAGDAIPIISINSLLPHRLAKVASEWGGRLIHFSTDCVFSGKRGKYTEDDLSDAEDLYGKTKFLGEVAGENALTLRTSIIGRELSEFKSLLEWFLARKHQTIRGYKKVIYSGVTTNYLSELVARIIDETPTLSGLYHVSSEPISKHDLLIMLNKAFRVDVAVLEDASIVSDRSMIGDKFVKATGLICPSWNELTMQLANDPTPYADWQLARG